MTPEERANLIVNSLFDTSAHDSRFVQKLRVAAKRTIENAIAAEREACARVAEEEIHRRAIVPNSLTVEPGQAIAAAIRSRGEQDVRED